MKIKDIIRWTIYGIIVAGAAYAIYFFVGKEKEYTEPEVYIESN